MPIEECPDPGVRAKLEGAMLACFHSETPASEVIGPWRNDHTRRDLERRHKPFPMRIPGKLQTISRLQLQVDGRHVIFPRFHDSVRIGIAKIPVLENFLPHPAERPRFGRTGLIVADRSRGPHSRAWHETRSEE